MRAYRLALYPDIGKGEDQRWDREAPAYVVIEEAHLPCARARRLPFHLPIRGHLNG